MVPPVAPATIVRGPLPGRLRRRPHPHPIRRRPCRVARRRRQPATGGRCSGSAASVGRGDENWPRACSAWLRVCRPLSSYCIAARRCLRSCIARRPAAPPPAEVEQPRQARAAGAAPGSGAGATAFNAGSGRSRCWRRAILGRLPQHRMATAGAPAGVASLVPTRCVRTTLHGLQVTKFGAGEDPVTCRSA